MNKLIHAITETDYAPAETPALLNITRHEGEYFVMVRSRDESKVSGISMNFEEFKLLCVALLAEVQK